MKKVLYILKHNPWEIGGGCYASAAYLNAFSEIFKEYEIDLFLCKEYIASINEYDLERFSINAVIERSLFSKLFSFITGRLHRHTSAVRKILAKNSSYDYCVFDHSSISGTLVKHINSLGIKTITIHHNYEPNYFKDNSSNLILRNLIYYQVVNNERIAFKYSKYNFFLTNEDYNTFVKAYGDIGKNSSIIGSFEKANVSCLNKKQYINVLNVDNLKIVISGSLSNRQNIDGIRYFFEVLYSSIPNEFEIIIAGKNPTLEIVNLVQKFDNVKLICNPENMDYIIQLADIYLCPARLGSGIKIRVMDGLRIGLPVISHKVSSRGYEIFEKDDFLRSFSTKEEFESQLYALKDSFQSKKVNHNKIQNLYLNNFSFDSGVARLKLAIGIRNE